MKRIFALITLLAMLMSCAAVYADTGVDERFMEVLNTPITEGNVKMDVGFKAGGGLFETLAMFGQDIRPIINNTSITYDLNVKGNETATKVAADGKVRVNSPDESVIPSQEVALWLNLDIEDTNNIQYYVILEMMNEVFAYEDYQYILMDFAKVPEFKEIIRLFKNMGLFDRARVEELLNTPELRKYIDMMLKDIDLPPVEYSNGRYSFKMGDAEYKKTLSQLFINLIDIILEVSADESLKAEAEMTIAELKEVLKPLADVQIFDAERGIVFEVLVDGANKPVEVNAEVNVVTNLFDIAKVIDETAQLDPGFTRESYGINVSLVANAKYTPLPEGYEVQFPQLTEENTYDVFADLGYESSSEDKIVVLYNGEEYVFENSPVIIEDRTFVPFRELANMLGISDEYISYDEATERVYLKYADIEIEMYIGSKDAYINGELKPLDVAAFTINDRTYIPVRYVSEAFGKNVDYAQSSIEQIITIND